jgi:hypothetical protein
MPFSIRPQIVQYLFRYFIIDYSCNQRKSVPIAHQPYKHSTESWPEKNSSIEFELRVYGPAVKKKIPVPARPSIIFIRHLCFFFASFFF